MELCLEGLINNVIYTKHMIYEAAARQVTIISETEQYLARDLKKYIKVAVGMWFLFGCDCDGGDAFRSTYYFFRHLDDVLDGDRIIDGVDPLVYAQDIRNSITAGNFSGNPILSLASRSLEHLNRVKQIEDAPQEEMLQLIDSMVDDRKRMKERAMLCKEELITQYHKQVDPIINLQFVALVSGLRVTDILDFPEVQAIIYNLIDLESDWIKGLITIPSEVLLEAGLDGSSDISAVLSSPLVKKWRQDECKECADKLIGIRQTLAEHFNQFGGKKSMPRNERITQIILNQLLNKIERYISKQLAV